MIRKPKCTTPSWSRVSWSTTWHILKNAVCFEHSKCTHIDRCSRLLPPSPANREHTQKWLLQAWRSETERKKEKKPFLQLFLRGHSLACHFLFSALADRDNNGRNQRWRDGKRMKRSKMDWEGENIRWVTAEETREPFTEAEPTVNSATQLENHYPTGCDFSNQCQTTDTTSDNSCVSTRPLYFYTMGRVYTVLRCRYSAVSQNS